MKKLVITALLLIILPAHGRSPMDQAKLAAPLPANLWIEMSKITQPGVVGVFLDIDLRRTRVRRDPMFEFFEEFFGRGFRYEDPRESTEEASPIGTGFIIDNKGHIVTNYHVIEPTDNRRLRTKLQVQISGESKLFDVDVVGRDPRGDLALLKLRKPPQTLRPLQFGDSDKLEVGEYVAAFGNPYGHSNSMTVGVVSAKGRAIKEINRFPFIQTDASINPGNSGGPLLNTKGYVIGVNTAIDARAQGIGFAIPSNYAKKIIGTLKNGGTIKRGFLGIGMASLHPRVALAYGIPKGGIVVTNVQPGFPAAQSGIEENDIIYQLNGKPVVHTEQFIDMIQDSEPGRKVKIKLLRPTDKDFKELTYNVTLANYPDKGQMARFTPPSQEKQEYPQKEEHYKGKGVPYDLGFYVVASTSGNRREFDVPIRFPFGPIVSGVIPGSPASRGGIKPGQVILRVNGEGVNSVPQVLQHLRPGVNRFWIHTETGEKKISLKSE